MQSRFSYSGPTNLSFWEKAKRRIKQTPVGSLSQRRLHVYNVGLERTGTTYIANLFSNFRSWHEPDWQLLLPFHDGRRDPTSFEVRDWLRSRDRALRLEVESSHPLGPLVPTLSKTFPGAQFICTIRSPKSWLRSVLDWSYPDGAGVRHNTHKPWNAMLRAYYRQEKQSEEYSSPVLEEHGLYTLEGYLKKWASHYNNIVQSVSQDRLCLVRTAKLSNARGRIAKFLDVGESMLTLPSERVNRSNTSESVYESIDSRLIDNRIDQYCRRVINYISKNYDIIIK